MIDVGLLHQPQELAGVGRQRLHVLPLALGVDGVECQRGLPGAGDAGQDDKLIPGNLDGDVLEVVFACPANNDAVKWHVLLVYRRPHRPRPPGRPRRPPSPRPRPAPAKNGSPRPFFNSPIWSRSTAAFSNSRLADALRISRSSVSMVCSNSWGESIRRRAISQGTLARCSSARVMSSWAVRISSVGV